MTECCACWDSGNVYGLEIKGEDYLKGQGILGNRRADNISYIELSVE